MAESHSSVAVTTDAVRQVGQLARQLASELATALDAVGHDVDALTTGGWRGEAADAYAEGWHECREGGHRVIRALAGLADKLGVNAEAYQATDTNTATEFVHLEGL
jgi:WXG100 family type VII secretion target